MVLTNAFPPTAASYHWRFAPLITTSAKVALEQKLWVASAVGADRIRVNGIKFPPECLATHKPKAGPLLFWLGFKKPLATIVSAWPCNPKVTKGAE